MTSPQRQRTYYPGVRKSFATIPVVFVVILAVLLSLHEIFLGTNLSVSSAPDSFLRIAFPTDTVAPDHQEELRDESPTLEDPNVARQLTLSHHESNGATDQKRGSLTIHTGSNCTCELLSVDCLDSIRCLPSTPRASRQSVAMGILTRKAMKHASVFQEFDQSWPQAPVGKGLQYASISAWQSWMQEVPLPIRFSDAPSIFVNETWYKYCQEHELVGKACFFDELDAPEDLSELEMDALLHANMPTQTEDLIQADVQQLRRQYATRPQLIPNLGYLLTFAHMVRIRFHLQSFLKDIFEKRVQRIRHVDTSDGKTLRVSLHMRRADACGHAQDGYETKGSPLDSPAQTSGKRKCYATCVYLDALKRAKEAAPPGTTIEVFLSTDHAGSVMDEIRDEYGELYKSMNWYFLNYSSENTFHYEGMIEGTDVESGKQAMLGESAVADLFLVSHGEVFIGHLGSRFGKLSWLLATSRRNAFVPFFSVDGHSFCCEIDEACEKVKPYIQSMENCMTFSHEMTHHIETNKDYWEVGSRVREKFVKSLKKK